MRYIALILTFLLLAPAPAMAFSHVEEYGNGLLLAAKNEKKKEKPVIVIKGKGGKVTKVNKPKPKEKK